MQIQFLLAIFMSMVSFSFIGNKEADRDEKKFFGHWTGSETDNQRVGLTKHWVQTRSKDGTFILMFTTIENCEVQQFVERGKWWLKDGLFYEYHNDGKTDVYRYEIIDDDHIKFKAMKYSVNYENAEHEFIDTKINPIHE